MWRCILIQHFSSIGSEQTSPTDTGELILQPGIWSKILLTVLLNYICTKDIFILKDLQTCWCSDRTSIRADSKFSVSDFSLEMFSLQKGFAEAFIAYFRWKLKSHCVVPSPNWTELLGFQSHFWYLWGFEGLLFLLCWIILLDQVTKGHFHEVQFHSRDNLPMKLKLLGNPSKQSPQSKSEEVYKDHREMQLSYLK